MKYIPIYLAAVLLLCLAPMPYGYFTLVRFLATLVFGIYAYKYYQTRKVGLMWAFVTLALLFLPFAKVGFNRVTWNIIDVIVAIGLIVLFFWEWKNRAKAERGSHLVSPDNSIKVDVVEDNRIEFKLEGKLSPKELIYVASEEDKELTDWFESNPEVFEGWGKMIGFQIVYLPLLMKKLADKNVLRYRAPYLSETELVSTAIGNNFLLQYLEHPFDRERIKHGFIRTEDIHRGSDGKDKAINRFYPLSSKSTEPIADQLHKIGKQISFEKNEHERLLEAKERSWDEWGDAVDSGADAHFNSQIDNENTDDLIAEVKARIAELRQRGISQQILEQLIHPDDRLSKAVYLLFLNHPEGILFKDLPSYRNELAEIYGKLRPGGLTDRASQSIEDVTNPLLNSINEKCARIRGAFVGQFDDHIARHYYIDGRRGEAKKISLPRDLIIWEE